MKEYKHKVQYYETDKMGIVHHSNCIGWFEEARIDYMEQIGLDFKTVEEAGFGSSVLSVECNYKEPFKFGDVAIIKVKFESVEKVRFRVSYIIYKDVSEKECVIGATTHCFLNSNGKPVSLKKEKPEWYEILKKYSE